MHADGAAKQKSLIADLAAARAGDRVASERLLKALEQRLRPELTRLIGTKLKAKLRPSDLLQEAFLEIVRRLPRFEGTEEDALLAWARTILANAVRKQGRNLSMKKRQAPEHSSQVQRLAKVLERRVLTPSAEVVQTEDVATVKAALLDLREEHRTVIELALFSELPIETVAERCNRTVAATRMLLSRARAAFAIALAARKQKS